MTVKPPQHIEERPGENADIVARILKLDSLRALRFLETRSQTLSLEVLDEVTDSLLQRLSEPIRIAPQDEYYITLWRSYLQHPDISSLQNAVEKFWRYMHGNVNILAAIASRIDVRQDPKAFLKALTLASEVPDGLRLFGRRTLGAAISDSTTGELNALNILLQHQAIDPAGEKQDDKNLVFQGNPFTCMVVNLSNSRFNRDSTQKAVRMLLDYGVSPRCAGWVWTEQLDEKGKNAVVQYHHESVMELLTTCLNHKMDGAMGGLLGVLIEEGVDWEHFDQGDSPSAALIRSHPRWRAQHRREALQALTVNNSHPVSPQMKF